MTSYGNLQDTETTEAAMTEYYERRRSVPAVQITHTPACERRHQARLDYEAKWPGYCRNCDGSGFHTWPGTYWEEGTSDPCSYCLDDGTCPRCMHRYETWDETAQAFVTCPSCGWDPQNGEACPDDECECWDTRSE